MNTQFQEMLLSMRPSVVRTVSVANAVDVHVLQSLVTAHKMGFINAILCGDLHQIEQVARDKLKKKLSDENGVTLIYVNYDEDVSVELIKEKVAQALN